MDNKELKEFIAWLPNNIEDFKDKTPEEIANILNDMSKTEDGMSAIEDMIATFKSSVMKYGLGNKILALAQKLRKNKKPVVKDYETSERSFVETVYPNGSIQQDIYRKKGFDGHTLISPEIILTRRVISPDKQDTSIYTIIDKDIRKLYDSDSTGTGNKYNGVKFNDIFDKAFSELKIGGKMSNASSLDLSRKLKFKK